MEGHYWEVKEVDEQAMKVNMEVMERGVLGTILDIWFPKEVSA